jgi:hypothetical protein
VFLLDSAGTDINREREEFFMVSHPEQEEKESRRENQAWKGLLSGWCAS